jgi:hypothetical protein
MSWRRARRGSSRQRYFRSETLLRRLDWGDFRQAFVAKRRVILSAIGWSPDGMQALLYLSSDGGPHDGWGECLLYDRLSLVDIIPVYRR